MTSLPDSEPITIPYDADGILNPLKIKNYVSAFSEAFNLFNKEMQKEKITFEGQELSKMEFIYCRETVKNVIREYPRVAKCVKEVMGKNVDSKVGEPMSKDEFIDAHKIASIFVMLILKHEGIVKTAYTNFDSEEPSETITVAKIPHIFFAFVLGIIIVEGMYNAKNKDKQKTFIILKEYWVDFAKLVYANKAAIQKPLESDCNGSINGLFFMSHLFYFVEKECQKFDKKIVEKNPDN
ncbi:hypothetical protein [Halarcobacter sp.]|uniref:hypothetical protein n=1 Tax=Halarcobacter sp. TaxID=2321133 RepID=UPI003A9437FD